MEGEQTTYNELVEFLRDKRKDVRLVAVEGIAQTSNSIEKYKFLRSTNVVRYLVRMVGEDDPQISRAVLSSLINFAADPTFLDQMLTNHVVSRIMDGLLDLENKVTELFAILLVNVTQQVRGVEKLLQKGDALEGYYVTKLVELFTTYDTRKEKEDSFSWIASVLNNVTQIREGRDLMTDRSRGLFVKLLPYIQHPNMIRQRGFLGVLSVHPWLLSDEIDILSKLLLPIRGPEVYDEEDTKALPAPLRVAAKDKVRERDLESRAMIIDSLLLLASTADSRKLMREKCIYVIIRDYDNEEENETISENLISLVTLLKGLDEDVKGAVSVNPLDVAKDHPAEVIQVSAKNLDFSATDNKPAQHSNTNANNSNPASTGKNTSKKDLDENGAEIEEI